MTENPFLILAHNTITARHCRICGTFHDELRGCPQLVPGYLDSADGKADARDQRKQDAK